QVTNRLNRKSEPFVPAHGHSQLRVWNYSELAHELRREGLSGGDHVENTPRRIGRTAASQGGIRKTWAHGKSEYSQQIPRHACARKHVCRRFIGDQKTIGGTAKPNCIDRNRIRNRYHSFGGRAVHDPESLIEKM